MPDGGRGGGGGGGGGATLLPVLGVPKDHVQQLQLQHYRTETGE